MTFLDFFSGLGGFRVGMEMANHRCIGHCEIDKFANKSYMAMHEIKEGEWFEEDITKVSGKEIPNADIWCIGFPCQDLSIAGKKVGIKGSRSGLFYKIMFLLEEKELTDRPKLLIIENVPQTLTINNGWDFARILLALDEAGYDAEWQVIDSANYVPQSRKRLFIVGHIRGSGFGKIFPIDQEECGNKVIQLDNFLPTKTRKNPNQGRIYSKNGLCPTLTTMGGGGRQPHIFTKKGIRRLTPKECFRLQGFSDLLFEKASKVNSDTQLHKQIGNSVTVPVVYAISKKIEEIH